VHGRAKEFKCLLLVGIIGWHGFAFADQPAEAPDDDKRCDVDEWTK
jgi:hypothetical protein